MTAAQAITKLFALRESNRIRSWSLIDNGDGIYTAILACGKVTISKNARSIGEAVAQAVEAIP